MRVKLPKLTGLKRLFSTKSIGTSFFLGAVVLLIATYGAYQLQQLFSPDTGNTGDFGNTRIQLRASDRTDKPNTSAPLFRELQPPSQDVPYYDYTYTANGPTVLSNNTLFRIQGEIYYKCKAQCSN